MLSENETRAFLGSQHAWSNAAVRLDDVQALFGGVRVHIPNWGPAFVTRVRPDGKELKFKIPFSREERFDFYRLCIEQDFLTIQPAERPGVPDEARPSIMLKNSKGQERTVARWAGTQDERFDAIYRVLLDLARRTEGRNPIPEKLRPWQKALFWAGVILLLSLPLVSGFLLARGALTIWWPEELAFLVGLLLLLVAATPPLLAGLRWWERRKAAYDRLFTNDWFLIIVSALLFAVLVTIPGFLGRISLVVWSDTAVGTVQTRGHISYLDADAGLVDEYKVAYSFQISNGRAYKRQVSVTQGQYETLSEGDPVIVHYLPFFPRYSLIDLLIEQETADYAVLLFTAVFAIYFIIGETAVFGPTIFRIQDERY